MKKPLLFISVLLFSFLGYSQVNLWTLIRNPDFEMYAVCPAGGSNVDTDLLHWSQASIASSDYFNLNSLCGFTGTFGFFNPPPMPADGTGFVGFFNTAQFGATKEYVATCLSSSLVPGTKYSMNFRLNAAEASGALPTVIGSSDLNTTIAIYGHSSCSAIPFAGDGCPSSNPGWVLLGDVNVTTAISSWTSHNITFTAPSTIDVIVIGPDCNPPNFAFSHYYFFDDAGEVKSKLPSDDSEVLEEKDIRVFNVFSPNDDGVNDNFEIRTTGVKSLSGSIYNRWGKLVYEIIDPEFKWEGKSGNQLLSEGVYYYVFDAVYFDETKETKKGFVQLIR